MGFTRITIIRRKAPNNNHVNKLLKWFGASLGLFSLRDKDSSCFRIFITLIHDKRATDEGLTSDEIAKRTNLTRGTVVHHLNKLIKGGMVINFENKYSLKVDKLSKLVDVVEEDILKTLQELRNVGEELDDMVGLH